MKKRIFSVLICGTIVTSLTACGSSGSSETVEEQNETEEEQAEEQDEPEVDLTEAEEQNNSQGEQEAVEEETQEKVDETGEDESNLPDLVWCFESLAKQVDLALMDEALRYVDDTGIAYEVVELSEEDLGTIITEDDEQGCHLFVAFIYNDNDDGTICTVSYGDDDFSGSVDDRTHSTDPVYTIYNRYSDEPNTEVGSLDDVMVYINEEMPALIAEENK